MGHATATVRVDSVGRGPGGRGYVFIGVLTDRFQNWEAAQMMGPYAWSYSSSGNAYHPARNFWDMTKFGYKSVVKVTLDAHRVTFNIDGTDQPTIILPEQCGNITL